MRTDHCNGVTQCSRERALVIARHRGKENFVIKPPIDLNFGTPRKEGLGGNRLIREVSHSGYILRIVLLAGDDDDDDDDDNVVMSFGRM